MTRATEYYPGRPAAEYPGRWVSGTIYGSDGRHHDRGGRRCLDPAPAQGTNACGKGKLLKASLG